MKHAFGDRVDGLPRRTAYHGGVESRALPIVT
jgi:hypothetical protein